MSSKQIIAKANLVAAKVDEYSEEFSDVDVFALAKYRIGFIDALTTTLEMTREGRLVELARMTEALGELIE